MADKLLVFLLFLDIELAKADKSGVGYAQFRKHLSRHLRAFPRLPDGLKEFMVDEMTRKRPFYPDKGKGTLDRVMERSIRVGCAIRARKNKYPSKSIHEGIMPELAIQEKVSIDSIRQDYEQRFMPIYEAAAIKATALMKEHIRTEKQRVTMEEFLRTDKGKVWAKKQQRSKAS